MGPGDPGACPAAFGGRVALTVRFAGTSQARIEEILLDSARHHGLEAAARYEALITAAVRLLQNASHPPYVQPVRVSPEVGRCTFGTPNGCALLTTALYQGSLTETLPR